MYSALRSISTVFTPPSKVPQQLQRAPVRAAGCILKKSLENIFCNQPYLYSLVFPLYFLRIYSPQQSPPAATAAACEGSECT